MPNMKTSRKISFPTGEIDCPYAVEWGWATTVIVVPENETDTDVTVTVKPLLLAREGKNIVAELSGMSWWLFPTWK